VKSSKALLNNEMAGETQKLQRMYDQYEYIGDFRNDLRHSPMGKCFFFNGDFYAGPWRDDMMDTTLVSSSNLNQTSIHSNDGLLIQKDGAVRYFGGFKANLKHGWGVLYIENYKIDTL
jgi:hypothetical protein